MPDAQMSSVSETNQMPDAQMSSVSLFFQFPPLPFPTPPPGTVGFSEVTLPTSLDAYDAYYACNTSSESDEPVTVTYSYYYCDIDERVTETRTGQVPACVTNGVPNKPVFLAGWGPDTDCIYGFEESVSSSTVGLKVSLISLNLSCDSPYLTCVE